MSGKANILNSLISTVQGFTPVQMAIYGFVSVFSVIFVSKFLFGGKKAVEKPTVGEKKNIPQASQTTSSSSSSTSSSQAAPVTTTTPLTTSNSTAKSPKASTATSTSDQTSAKAAAPESSTSTTTAAPASSSVAPASNDSADAIDIESFSTKKKNKDKNKQIKKKKSGKGKSKGRNNNKSNAKIVETDGNDASASDGSDSDEADSSPSSVAVSAPSSASQKSIVHNKFNVLTSDPDRLVADSPPEFEYDQENDQISFWEKSKKRQKSFRKREELKSSDDLSAVGTAEEAPVATEASSQTASAVEEVAVVVPQSSSSDVAHVDESAVELEDDIEDSEPQIPHVEHIITLSEPSLRGAIIGRNGKNRQDIIDFTGVKELSFSPKDQPGDVTATLVGEEEKVKLAEAAIKELCEKGYSTILESKKDPEFRETSIRFFRPYLLDRHNLLSPNNIKIIKSHFNVHIHKPRIDMSEPEVPGRKIEITLAGAKEKVAGAKAVMNSIKKFYHHEITHPGVEHKEMAIASEYIPHIIGAKFTNKNHLEQSLGVTIYTPGDQKNYLENENLVIVGKPQSIQAAEEAINQCIKKVDEVNQQKKLQELDASRKFKAGERGAPRKPRYGDRSSSNEASTSPVSGENAASGLEVDSPAVSLTTSSNDSASLEFSNVFNFPRLLERNSSPQTGGGF